MFPEKPFPPQFPQVPLERRVGAFLIDFVSVWLLSSFTGTGIVQGLVFVLAWLALRVIVVERNQGQSLGRWALNMKVIDVRLSRVPDLIVLAKREGLIAFAAWLAMVGLQINLKNALSMLLLALPLIVECAVAFTDDQLNQALHDRLAQTTIVPVRRGFALDLKLRDLFAQIQIYLRNRTR